MCRFAGTSSQARPPLQLQHHSATYPRHPRPGQTREAPTRTLHAATTSQRRARQRTVSSELPNRQSLIAHVSMDVWCANMYAAKWHYSVREAMRGPTRKTQRHRVHRQLGEACRRALPCQQQMRATRPHHSQRKRGTPVVSQRGRQRVIFAPAAHIKRHAL